MPLCRTTRAFTTTRREGDFIERDSAALRPRPKVEREPFQPLAAEARAGMARLLRGPHHLGDVTLGFACALAAIANAAGPNAQIVVAVQTSQTIGRLHGWLAFKPLNAGCIWSNKLGDALRRGYD